MGDITAVEELNIDKAEARPYRNEQKRELLKPESLANLSTEEYIELWRCLNPHFLTHVTRQGFRDHTGDNIMVMHYSGYGEYVNGFTEVMRNDRKLLPALARLGMRNRDEETVRTFLSPLFKSTNDTDKAKAKFMQLLNLTAGAAPKYPDITATHFAVMEVIDEYYGGERDNEVFFVFPADVLASQYPYDFNSGRKDFTVPAGETKWNDLFVWTDINNPGVPVDSGIVFLPEMKPVDPETGSKYASEVILVEGQEKRAAIEDTVKVDTFVGWGKAIDNQSPLKRAVVAYKEDNTWHRPKSEEECLGVFVSELQRLGFEAEVSTEMAGKLVSKLYWEDVLDEEVLLGIIRSSNAHLKLAENPIPAKKYWEDYFARNPELRPKHVYYYNGDPTTAVMEFQKQNGIGSANTSKTDGLLLGFDDNHVSMWEDSRVNVGYEELVATANKLIDEHYAIANTSD